MTQRIGGTVQSGRLAVPDPDHPVVFAALRCRSELRSLDDIRGEFLVDTGPKDDGMLIEEVSLSAQLEIVPSQRRAFVSADEYTDPSARGRVSAALFDRDPNQRLQAGQKYFTIGDGVPVTEGELSRT